MANLSKLDTAQPMDIAAEVWQELPTAMQRQDTYSEISALAHNRDYAALAQILEAARELRPNINYTDARQVHIHYNPIVTTTTTTTTADSAAPAPVQAFLLVVGLIGLLVLAAANAGERAGTDASRSYIQGLENQKPLLQ